MTVMLCAHAGDGDHRPASICIQSPSMDAINDDGVNMVWPYILFVFGWFLLLLILGSAIRLAVHLGSQLATHHQVLLVAPPILKWRMVELS